MLLMDHKKKKKTSYGRNLGDTRAVVYVLFTTSSQHRDVDPLIHVFIIFIKPYPFSNFNKNTMPCWLCHSYISTNFQTILYKQV